MKKYSLFVIALLVLGLVLVACGAPAQAPVEEAAPAEEAAPVDEAVEEPTEAVAVEEPTEAVAEEPTAEVVEEPGETEGAAPAQDGKWCSGTDIVFFPGGPPGGPFAQVVANGAIAAAADLGANVEYVWSDWNPEQMVTQFAEAAATNPDGIAIMGHPGDDAFEAVVDDAEAQGIIVTSQNTTLPRLEEKYASNGFGYVGAELYSAGYALGAEAASRFGLGEGDRAMVWGLLAQAGRGERTKGVIDALEEAGLTVDYLEIDDATNADASAGIPTFVGYASANPDVKLVVTDHGALTGTQQTYFEAAGLGPDDIIGAGFDLNVATVEAIRSGYTDLVIDQQQWLQGYLPILQICLTHNYLFTGLHIDTGAGFAHADNVELLADLVSRQIR
ncbi:MAG: substrate-binding domain-containing protein [Candidatus Promineifilaceae bacterium]|jgi:simple sugar transport system substrate-binding protein